MSEIDTAKHVTVPSDIVRDGDPVDDPRAAHPHIHTTRAPILPAWATSLDAFRSAAGAYCREAAHVTAYHVIRAPLYIIKVLVRVPVGLGRVIAGTFRWVADPSSASYITTMAGTGIAPNEYSRLIAQRRQGTNTRIYTALAGVVVVAAAAVAIAYAGAYVITGASLVTSLGLGWIGRDKEHPLIDNGAAIRSMNAPRLTSELILIALGSLGIARLDKLGTDVAFPAPIARDGRGWRATIDLPPGVTAGDIVGRRDKLASGLRRPIGCVWPEGDQNVHAGRLILWVGDRQLSGGAPVVWPLEKSGRVNIFEQIRVGDDHRGRPVSVSLMYASGLIGAVPRMGKSFTLRLLCLAAALDPRTEIHVFDLKGSGDHAALGQVAHSYRAGDDDEDIEYLMASIRSIRADMSRRYKVVRGLPRDLCPESKTTDQLASQPNLGLHPVLLAIDECQYLFEHKTHGKEAESITMDLVKRGPAVGIMTWCATQRPDAQSIPKGISDNVQLRIALRVMGQIPNDMILGSGAYRAGISAATFSRTDLGVALVVGEGDEPTICRSAYLDSTAAFTVAARARAARIAAGRLTGYASGMDQEVGEPEAGLLDHLAAAWPRDAARCHLVDLAVVMGEQHPDLYRNWGANELGQAARAAGLTVAQVKSGGEGRKGLTLTEIDQALTERDRNRRAGNPDEGGSAAVSQPQEGFYSETKGETGH